MINAVSNPKSKKLFSVRSLWRLRYRMYAIVIMIVLLPIMFASNEGLPPKIDVIGYETVSSNVLYDVIVRNTPGIPESEPLRDPDFVAGNGGGNTGSSVLIDKTGRDITEALRRAGYNLGFISSDAFVDLGFYDPENQEKILVPEVERPLTLDDLVARPASPQYVNFLRYPQYNINVPLIYSSLEDLFNVRPNCDRGTDPQGCLDFSSPRDNGPTDSPIQRKLQDGVVHIAFTPMPGETGNSYIVGHSSNYSWVPSAYNSVFKPLERKSQPGEEFIIYDRFGRELRFRVFETLEILESDTATAYQNYPDKRVVTLQTSILEFVPGRGFMPTKRWLTRGELIV